jgi:endogenous inhibitor of DNA gyrase (YacG/DUF329 family)
MKVKCPRCGAETTYEGNPFHPFCGERCKLVDLGKWMSEVYRVPTTTSDEEEDAPPPSTESKQER